MKSKITWCILIFLVLFNFIFMGFVYADDDETFGEEEYEKLNEGKASIDGEDYNVSVSETQAAGAAQLFAAGGVILTPLAILSTVVNKCGIYRTESEYSAYNVGWFNIGSLVFDEYLMFDINVAQTSEDLNSDVEGTKITNIMDELKTTIVGLYRFMNTFCVIVFFILAIYTWIRVFLANTAEDKAKYKKVANTWVKAIIFLVFAFLIIVTVNVLWKSIMDFLYNIRLSIEKSGAAGFESILFKNCYEGVSNYSGFKAFLYFIELVMFMIVDFIFFWKYIKRSFKIFALVMFAPVYAVVDVIKKLNNKEGALSKWFNSYLSNVFIQPFHALMYLAFMMVGSNIVLNAPIIGILLLYALLTADKIGKIMLDFGKDTVGSLFARDPEKAT